MNAKSPKWLLLLAFVSLLAACTAEQALPTLIPTATEAPATETPLPSDTPAPVLLPTLPPTWTPTFTPQPEILPTATTTEVVVDLPVSTLVIACDTFFADPTASQIEFELGTSPTVAWTFVEGAERYRLFLLDDTGAVLRDDIYVAETNYAFPADSFVDGKFYGWSVYPINQYGDQMCFERGLELVPFVPR